MLKLVISGLVQYYKNDKKDMLYGAASISMLIAFLYVGFLLAPLADK